MHMGTIQYRIMFVKHSSLPPTGRTIQRQCVSVRIPVVVDARNPNASLLPHQTTTMPRAPKTNRVEHSPVMRARICGMREAGLSWGKIWAKTNLPISTIRSICAAKGAQTGDYKSKKRVGRPRITTPEEDAELIRRMKTMPTAIYGNIRAEVCPHLSLDTLKRRAYEAGLRKWRAAKRPPLDPARALRRYNWCKEREHWDIPEWSKVVFSDECSVQRGAGLNPTWVLRTPKQKWERWAVEKQILNGRVSVMVWAAFSAERRSRLIIMDGDPQAPRGGVTARVYKGMLESELPTLLDADSIFMQDNAPIHNARIVKEFLEDLAVNVMDWPPYSPDLNPIEHCWFPLKNNMHTVQAGVLLNATGRDGIRSALGQVLPVAWEEIKEEHLLKLIKSMKKRVAAVIKADGWYTKY